MAVQWPLILFTTFIAWCCGLFASQSILMLKGEAKKAQMPAWIVSAILLVVGGICVFFHLQHWERIFNGFGHITSGITQELIGIVLLAVIAIIYLVYLRRGDMKKWVPIVGIILSAALVIVMAHSYLMAARPAWNTFAWILCVFGSACGLGPATMAVIIALTDKESEKSGLLGWLNIGGSAINALFTIIYVAVASAATSSLVTVGYYSNPVKVLEGMVDVSNYSPFAGDNATLTILALIAVVLTVVLAIVGKKQGKWMVIGIICVILALIAAIAIRVVFYQMGVSVYMFY